MSILETAAPASELPVADHPVVYALHENPDWFGPFAAAFAAEGVEVREWLLVDGAFDFDQPPPEGVFWSRISASSHTRGHGLSKEYARGVLSWLEAYGRRTVNGRRVLEFEVSKIDQLTALKAFGIEVPRTVAVVGRERLVEAARGFATPFITKHNQGGKGLGVRRFDSHADFADYVASDDFEQPQDGITLIQEYVQAARPFVTRVELVGGEVVYAITADTERGGFQLCPADACAIDPASGLPVIPPGATLAPEPGRSLFALREGFEHPILETYRAFTRAHGIEVAGIEFIETADGRVVTYDVNTNTNYNAEVEAIAPRSAPRQVARHLAAALAERYPA